MDYPIENYIQGTSDLGYIQDYHGYSRPSSHIVIGLASQMMSPFALHQ